MLQRLNRPSLVAAIAFCLTITSCVPRNPPPAAVNVNPAPKSSRLDRLKKASSLICGVNGQLPGFSYVNEKSEYSGIDVDFCRAIAAALYDDPTAVKFRNLSAQDRIEALQADQIDILSRNTTWTLSRDAKDGLEFAPILFYDGQSILVSKAGGVRELADLEGKSICVQSGTTTEVNLADHMRQIGIIYKPVVFDDPDAMYATYKEGRCAGASSDRSQLIVRRAEMTNPTDHILLNDVLSKEPLAPVVKDDDAQWFDVVKWVAYVLIEAEELKITSKNLPEMLESKDPNIRRFLGVEGDIGEQMGLSNDFAARIIKHVGNYGEIYDRNLGKPFELERGYNALWKDGGLLYAPPFR